MPENGLDVQTTCQGGESDINVVSAPELTRTSRVVILKASDVPIMDSPPNHHPKIVLHGQNWSKWPEFLGKFQTVGFCVHTNAQLTQRRGEILARGFHYTESCANV